MKPLLEYLKRYEPVPHYAQIATGGTWEQAVRLDFATATDSHPLTHTIDPSIAGEIFYRLSDERLVFLGLRYSPLLQSVATPTEFLQKFQETLQLVPSTEILEVFADLGRRLNDDPDTYMKSKISHVELGVIDYWKSMGSMVLRRPGQPSLTQTSVKQLLHQNESLLRNQSNHTALEFAVDTPQHWIAIQTSGLRHGEYVTDIDALTELTHMA